MIDCESFAREWKSAIKQNFEQTKKDKYLAIVQVGNDPASNAYVKGKVSDCKELGIPCRHFHLEETIEYQEAQRFIYSLNDNRECGGIIVQLPLPERFKGLPHLINPDKDIDGLRKNSPFTPCTAKAVMKLIKWLGYDLKGKNVAIIGRSKLVGKPLIDLMLAKNATVISCNSHTVGLSRLTLLADVIVSATGVKGLIKPGMVGGDALVIDVGITRGEDGHLYGDCDKRLYECLDTITPVPKGVGLLTRCALLDNFLEVCDKC